MMLPFGILQSLIVLSALALARIFPSGENATKRTCLLCPLNGCGGESSAMFQIKILLSLLLLAMSRPSGEKATELIISVWPLNPGLIRCQDVAFQTLTILSSPALAANSPSGE